MAKILALFMSLAMFLAAAGAASAQTSPSTVSITYKIRSAPGTFPSISVGNQGGKSVQIARPVVPAWLKLAGDTAYPRATPLVAQFRLDSTAINAIIFPDSGAIRDSIVFSYTDPGTSTTKGAV